jgi:hypothetical protein
MEDHDRGIKQVRCRVSDGSGRTSSPRI